MKQEIKQQIGQSVQGFRLPRYQEIPDVGLYLEQATKYICRYLSPILETPLTASMISNYVKRGLLSSPVKKQYSRDQVAYLFFIAVAKNAMIVTTIKTITSDKKYPFSNVALNSLIESAVAGILNRAIISIGQIMFTTTQYFLYAGVLTRVLNSLSRYALNGVLIAKLSTPSFSLRLRPDLLDEDTKYTPFR